VLHAIHGCGSGCKCGWDVEENQARSTIPRLGVGLPLGIPHHPPIHTPASALYRLERPIHHCPPGLLLGACRQAVLPFLPFQVFAALSLSRWAQRLAQLVALCFMLTLPSGKSSFVSEAPVVIFFSLSLAAVFGPYSFLFSLFSTLGPPAQPPPVEATGARLTELRHLYDTHMVWSLSSTLPTVPCLALPDLNWVLALSATSPSIFSRR
jgi:hypothetical protein